MTSLLPAGAMLATDTWRQMGGSCALPGGTTVDCDSAAAPGCVGIDASTGKCPSGHATCFCQDQTGAGEPSFVRLRVDAPGGPASAPGRLDAKAIGDARG